MIIYIPNLKSLLKNNFKGISVRFKNHDENFILIKPQTIEERERIKLLLPVLQAKLEIKIKII